MITGTGYNMDGSQKKKWIADPVEKIPPGPKGVEL
jgi:hypothetical protein